MGTKFIDSNEALDILGVNRTRKRKIEIYSSSEDEEPPKKEEFDDEVNLDSFGIKLGESSFDISPLDNKKQRAEILREDGLNWEENISKQASGYNTQWEDEMWRRRKILESDPNYKFAELVAGFCDVEVHTLYSQDDLSTIYKRQTFQLEQQKHIKPETLATIDQKIIRNDSIIDSISRIATAIETKRNDYAETQKMLNNIEGNTKDKMLRIQNTLIVLTFYWKYRNGLSNAETIIDDDIPVVTEVFDVKRKNKRTKGDTFRDIINKSHYATFDPSATPDMILSNMVKDGKLGDVLVARIKGSIFDMVKELILAREGTAKIFDKILQYFVPDFNRTLTTIIKTMADIVINVDTTINGLNPFMIGMNNDTYKNWLEKIRKWFEDSLVKKYEPFYDVLKGLNNRSRPYLIFSEKGNILMVMCKNRYETLSNTNTMKDSKYRSEYVAYELKGLNYINEAVFKGNRDENDEWSFDPVQTVLYALRVDGIQEEEAEQIEPPIPKIPKNTSLYDLKERLRYYEKVKNALRQQRNEILEGKTKIVEPKYPYMHRKNWVEDPINSGRVTLTPTFVSAMKMAYSTTQKWIKGIEKWSEEDLQRSPKTDTHFARLVAAYMRKNNTMASRTWKPKESVTVNNTEMINAMDSLMEALSKKRREVLFPIFD